jgi:HlyD family secretion protein
MKFLGMSLLALILLATGAALGIFAMREWGHLLEEKPPTAKAAAPREKPLPKALGRTEPAGGVITIGVPVPDRIANFCKGIRKGERVKAGADLVVLDSQRDRQSEYEMLVMQCKEAEEKYEHLKDLGQKKIALEALRLKQLDAMEPIQERLQKAKVGLLEKQLEATRDNLNRLVKLGSSAISAQEKEQQELLVFQAQSELQTARAMAEQRRMETKLERDLVNAKRVAAEAELTKSLMELPRDQLRRQAEVAKRKLDETTLKAPIDGTILRLLASPGEIVGGVQSILEIADLSKMAVIAEVYETDRSQIKVGQRVQVTNKRVWGEETADGVVESIGTQVGKNRIFDADPTANVDRRVFEVRILLDTPKPAAELIHLQVEVRFLGGKGG